MNSGTKAKLDRLVDRLGEAHRLGLSATGEKYLKDRLRYRLELRDKAPDPPGRPGAERDYVVQVIAGREAAALESAGVAEEVEAAGGTIRR